MKKLFTLLLFTCVMSVYAQDTFREAFDKVFANVSRKGATTGILYERVIPFAKLFNYNSNITSVDTSNSQHFIQAYYELYNAAFQPTARLPFEIDSIKSIIKRNKNTVDIGILHYKFNSMDSSIAYQKLYFDSDSILHENSSITTSLYVEKEVFIASPLKKIIDIGTTTFRFSDILLFDNTENPIVNLKVDFDDGKGLQPISNEIITIDYLNSGIKTLHFEAIFQNGDTLISYSTISCSSLPRGNSNNKSGWQYIDSLSFTGNNAIKAKIATSYDSEFNEKAKGEVWIYYAQSGNQLRKPMLIVDGFDPENNRNFESHKKEDDNPDAQSIWALLGNGLSASQNVGKQMLQKGYDLVILDLPEGGTYIERNAMVCIEVINKINTLLVQSGSKEDIVVVGPSMGGQITRYALAYMEKNPEPNTNNGKHNCRLWISFDSPHQGANISLGAQAFIHHFKGMETGAQTIWDKTLNCLAAQQLLIHHKNSDANSIYNNYYQSLKTLGYPTELRKIAVANGSLSNTPNGNGSELAFKMVYPWVLFNIDARIRFYPSPSETTNVFSAFWFVLGLPVWKNETVESSSSDPCSIDAAPGGYYNTFEQINDQAKNWANVTNLYFSNHCFMPIPSVLDISGKPDYCTDFSTTDLVATGKIPFAAYWGSTSINMDHVEFSQDLVDWLTNEIETYIEPKGKRQLSMCGGDTAHYTVHFPAGKTSTVNWACSNNLQIISGQGTKTIIVKPIGFGKGWVEATLTGNSILTHNKTLKKYEVEVTFTEPVTIAPTTINNNRVWAAPVLALQDITILSGASLAVSSTLYLSAGVKIIVNPGGKLIVHGGTLTNACPGQMWNGVIVQGDLTKPMTQFYQGFVQMDLNGKIENAVCGVTVNGGGMVVANNASFINNTRAVKFWQIASGQTGTSGTFTNVNFILNNSYMGNPQEHKGHLNMEECGEVLVTDCIFSILFSTNSDRGIVALNTTTKWSGTNLLTSIPVTIQEGATLINMGTIKSNDKTTILIEPKGKLCIDGGTFTNAVSNQMWKGVVVQGNPALPVTQANQGFLQILNNGKIENSVCGIQVQGGGMVETNNAQIINNQTGVEFLSLSATNKGIPGIFTNTNFEINFKYIGNINNFAGHLKMNNCGEVKINDCTFSGAVSSNTFNGITVENAATTWAGNNELGAIPVTLLSGATLTNTGIVSSSAYTTITVHPGANLFVDGGTFTNDVSNLLWKGITVLGDPTKPMNKIYQGYLDIKNNGKIENAVCGITVHGGGRVETLFGAHFINNTHAIKFLPLAQGQSGTSGIIKDAIFTINNNYWGNIEDFETHIKAESSGKISIIGCTFLSSAPREFCNYNYGIFASNTDIDMGAKCSSLPNCPYGIKPANKFSGFNIAAYAINTGSSPAVRIRYSEFRNNDNGVIIDGINGNSVIRNEFIVNNDSVGSSIFSTGLYVANATGYKIEENRFVDTISQSGLSIGLHISNSGIPENEVYKNYFKRFSVAQKFEGKNSSVNGNAPGGALLSTGLQTLCNEFNENSKDDIHVGTYPFFFNPPIQSSIRDNQGGLRTPAGNLFDNIPQMNINNTNSNYRVNYYYGTLLKEQPLKYNNTFISPTLKNRNCPERNGPPEAIPDTNVMKVVVSSLSQYDEWNAAFEYWLTLLKVTPEGSEEYYYILDNVSYYSALKDNYFNSIISARLGAWLEEKEEIGKESLYEDLRFLFAYRNHYTDNLSIAETYLAQSNFREAQSTLSAIFEKFKLSEEQVSELISLQIFIRWLQQLEEKGETIYKLPENEIEYLVNYVETHSGRGVVFANNILCGLYNICRDNYELRITNYENEMEEKNDVVINQSSSAQSELSEFKKVLANITLIPNPTTGQLTINSGQLTIESVEIFDIYGKKIFEEKENLTVLRSYDLTVFPVGIYFVKIKTEAGEVMKKVVKN